MSFDECFSCECISCECIVTVAPSWLIFEFVTILEGVEGERVA